MDPYDQYEVIVPLSRAGDCLEMVNCVAINILLAHICLIPTQCMLPFLLIFDSARWDGVE